MKAMRHVVSAGGLVLLAVLALPGRPLGAAGAAPDGAALFRQRCVMCHAAVPGKTSPLGPNLVGVHGRRAGTANFAYSPAMKASGITWDAASLERYLASPARTVPGSKMTVAVPDAAQRAALIAYLATLR